MGQQPVTALRDNLERSLEATVELKALLEEEARQLRDRERADLAATAERKRDRLELLERLDGERRRLVRDSLAESGQRDAGEALEELVANSGDPGLQKAWRDFSSQLLDCREHNHRNGHVIHLQQRQVEQSLRILRGAGNQAPDTYDASGKTRGESGGNRFARA